VNWAAFFNMGGYAFSVWGSYLVGLIILGLNIWLPLRQYRAQQKKVRQQHETSS